MCACPRMSVDLIGRGNRRWKTGKRCILHYKRLVTRVIRADGECGWRSSLASIKRHYFTFRLILLWTSNHIFEFYSIIRDETMWKHPKRVLRNIFTLIIITIIAWCLKQDHWALFLASVRLSLKMQYRPDCALPLSIFISQRCSMRSNIEWMSC